MALQRLLTRTDGFLERLESGLLVVGVLGLAALSIGNTLARNLAGTSVPGVRELTELLMIWITFVGIAYAVRRARHIAMTAFYEQLRGRLRKAVRVTICLGSAALMFFLAWYAVEYVAGLQARGRETTALRIPIWIPYLIVPVGLALAGVQHVLTAWRNLTTAGVHRSFTEPERHGDPGP